MTAHHVAGVREAQAAAGHAGVEKRGPFGITAARLSKRGDAPDVAADRRAPARKKSWDRCHTLEVHDNKRT